MFQIIKSDRSTVAHAIAFYERNCQKTKVNLPPLKKVTFYRIWPLTKWATMPWCDIFITTLYLQALNIRLLFSMLIKNSNVSIVWRILILKCTVHTPKYKCGWMWISPSKQYLSKWQNKINVCGSNPFSKPLSPPPATDNKCFIHSKEWHSANFIEPIKFYLLSKMKK